MGNSSRHPVQTYFVVTGKPPSPANTRSFAIKKHTSSPRRLLNWVWAPGLLHKRRCQDRASTQYRENIGRGAPLNNFKWKGRSRASSPNNLKGFLVEHRRIATSDSVSVAASRPQKLTDQNVRLDTIYMIDNTMMNKSRVRGWVEVGMRCCGFDR